MERITLQRGANIAHFTSYATSSISNGDSANVPWSNHPVPSQRDQTPSYGAFGFQRTDYDLRPRHNRFISFADTNFLKSINTPYIPDYTLRSKMGNCAIKQWRLTAQQSCKNILCFST